MKGKVHEWMVADLSQII